MRGLGVRVLGWYDVLMVGPCEAKIVLVLAASFRSCRGSIQIKVDQFFIVFIY